MGGKRVTERGQHFLRAESGDECSRSAEFRRERDEFDSASGNALQFFPKLRRNGRDIGQRMCAACAFRRADERPFEMIARNAAGDVGIEGKRFIQLLNVLAKPFARRGDERRQHMRDAGFPKRTNRAGADLAGVIGVVEIHAHESVALQIHKARPEDRRRLCANATPACNAATG